MFGRFMSQTFATLKTATISARNKRETERIIARFYKHQSKVRLVKTLWQVDKAVDISTFYCESHVYIKEVRRKIVSMSDLDGLGNLLVEGIAGQGKSIFLRYLCGVELVRGQYIPIFLELRRVQPHTNLLDYLLGSLAEIGLQTSADGFREVASSGRVLLLLDGFDEVNEEDKPEIIAQVEHLVNTHDNLRVIITSRPHSGMEVSPIFHVLRLSDLQGDEYKTVIFKLLEDSKTATELIKQVQAHQGDVSLLLKTPLLVTLLVLNYKSFQEIPAHLSGFYDSLFKLLLQRHDGTKPGYRRQRLCSINDTEYRLVFEAFCYLAKKHRKGVFDHATVYSIAKEAFNATGIKEDAEKFIRDIVNITCLLVKDGEEYRFIHKSVQEYYAACFIKNKPDVVATTIYQRLFTSSIYGWDQELRFLSEIDGYRFRKFGFIPAICRYLKLNESDLMSTTPEQVQPAVEDHIRSGKMLRYTDEEPERPEDASRYATTVKTIPTLGYACVHHLFEIDYAAVRELFEVRLNQHQPKAELSLAKAFESGLLRAPLTKAANQMASELLRIAKEALSRNTTEEHDPLALMPLE